MTESSRTEEFLRHYAQSESQVYAYIRTLLLRRADGPVESVAVGEVSEKNADQFQFPAMKQAAVI
jgi:hypothetical protein